jgi:hypothetical protein
MFRAEHAEVTEWESGIQIRKNSVNLENSVIPLKFGGCRYEGRHPRKGLRGLPWHGGYIPRN